ncbi:MAG: DNA translocase FtsK [Chloroflexi bacterium]|nr:DNA translocase FtsK [Chloroflexota bacterium]
MSSPFGIRSRVASSLYLKLAGVAVVAVAAVAVAYTVVEPVRDFFTSVRDEILTAVGLGTVPIGIWLAVFIGVLWVRRSWFRFANLWLGSIALLALVIGFLGFFEPDSGVLGGFTPEGDVALGGQVGSAIIGSASITGALRLIGIMVLGAAVVSPPLAKDAAVGMAKGSMFAYFVSIFAVRWAVSHVPRKRPQRPGREKPSAGDDVVDQFIPPRRAPTYSIDRSQSVPDSVVSLGPAAVSEAPVSSDPFAEGDETVELQYEIPEAEVVSVFDRSAEVESEAETEAPGKFNRFWGARTAVVPSAPEPEPILVADAELEQAPAEVPDVHKWASPPMSLLETTPESGISKQEMQHTADTIVRTLSEYGVEVEIGDVRPGPTVTMYGLTPGWVRRTKQVKKLDEHGKPVLDEAGRQVVNQEETRTRVRVDSILSREKDLALALKTQSIRIETPAMGTSQVGIEVPNPNPSLVSERSVMESEDFKNLRSKAALPVALGKGSGGETVVIDLAKMPHLLIAGATGSGKSVCINAIISCLLMEKSPAEMRLLLIDPKRVELTPFNGIPHLLAPVVVETDQVVGLLKGLIQEMMDRYRQFESVGARNIELYNKKMPEQMPYLVVAVDELADLMMTAAFDVEQSLCRLAQLGRATGIHLIVATQRPSVDVVTGLIKANFPSRIAFGVSSQVDSRTILDSAGADKLLGRGDMLYLPIDASTPKRIQNVFISDREISNLVSFWQATPRGPRMPMHLRVVKERPQGDDSTDEGPSDQVDELLDKAIELGRSYSKLSTSLLQRRMRIGYPRAARLMDQLEERGVIGPSDGSKSRDVIINQSPTDVSTQ